MKPTHARKLSEVSDRGNLGTQISSNTDITRYSILNIAVAFEIYPRLETFDEDGELA